MARLILASLLLWSLSVSKCQSTPCILREITNNNKVCVCNATYCDTVERVQTIPKKKFVTITSSQEGLRFDKKTGAFTVTPTEKGLNYITTTKLFVDNSKQYQTILGFGGAFTDSVGLNILYLRDETQEQLLRAYFSEDGIEYNLCRVPISGTDFSLHPYTYDDGEADPELVNFKLAWEDHTFRIPFIKRAQAMSSREIRLAAASWSPPLWMKTRQVYSGFSQMKGDYYDTYTKYLLRFLEEYKKQNISIWSISTGNEPSDGIWPLSSINSLGWTPWSMAKWVANYFGPQLRSSPFNQTVVLSFEDQRLFLPWWIEWAEKAEKDYLQYVDGFSVHWYYDFLVGAHVLNETHEKYPDKFLLYSEACIGDEAWEKKVVYGSWKRGERYLGSIIKNLNAWVTGWVDWNLVLDSSGGPTYIQNLLDSPIIVNATYNEFYKQPMYYALGHVSKFIERDAKRIYISPTESQGLLATAVQNPDGRIVVVIMNENDKEEDVSVSIPKKGWMNMRVPARSFITSMC